MLDWWATTIFCKKEEWKLFLKKQQAKLKSFEKVDFCWRCDAFILHFILHYIGRILLFICTTISFSHDMRKKVLWFLLLVVGEKIINRLLFANALSPKFRTPISKPFTSCRLRNNENTSLICNGIVIYKNRALVEPIL